jgi:hypothetical protein
MIAAVSTRRCDVIAKAGTTPSSLSFAAAAPCTWTFAHASTLPRCCTSSLYLRAQQSSIVENAPSGRHSAVRTTPTAVPSALCTWRHALTKQQQSTPTPTTVPASESRSTAIPPFATAVFDAQKDAFWRPDAEPQPHHRSYRGCGRSRTLTLGPSIGAERQKMWCWIATESRS